MLTLGKKKNRVDLNLSLEAPPLLYIEGQVHFASDIIAEVYPRA